MLVDVSMADVWILFILAVVFFLGLVCGKWMPPVREDNGQRAQDDGANSATYYHIPARKAGTDKNQKHLFADCCRLRGRKDELETLNFLVCDTCINRVKKRT